MKWNRAKLKKTIQKTAAFCCTLTSIYFKPILPREFKKKFTILITNNNTFLHMIKLRNFQLMAHLILNKQVKACLPAARRLSAQSFSVVSMSLTAIKLFGYS
ncbi:hypothetical protein CSKR_202295 [Clonorchis sinensis]|uniref:Uncharacterized protein n=1 Tax=Clonorchis sinensis TaxID=79923 RepID=A0A8T1MUD7_CLOSI|nr:hypothetical protein CSKR_202295 [Clonorchis sinensis]